NKNTDFLKHAISSLLLYIRISSAIYSIQENTADERTQTHRLDFTGSSGNFASLLDLTLEITQLAERFCVSRTTIHEVLNAPNCRIYITRRHQSVI
ncbi:hypothetical protein, partial [Nitrosomonas sp.]|uniref:hypothetical protein n=1 Tax=Nitrosomonas sp. TaxID=42353 RepID=UPI0033064A4F